MAKTKAADRTPLEEATEKGYLGTTPDDTPNEAYTVAGVTAHMETPETVQPGADGSTKLPDADPKG